MLKRQLKALHSNADHFLLFDRKTFNVFYFLSPRLPNPAPNDIWRSVVLFFIINPRDDRKLTVNF